MIQIISLQERPLQSPTRPTQTTEDATPTGALVSNLRRTVQRQTSLIEEQNRRLMDLEQARPLVRAKRTPSQVRSRRGRSPHQSRSRSPRHSISVRSPTQSPPRRSSPRRSPPRRNRRSWSSSSSEDTREARNDRNAYGPFIWRI